MVTIDLTDEQYCLLKDLLLDYDDCGPLGEGWQSDALKNLCDEIITQGPVDVG